MRDSERQTSLSVGALARAYPDWLTEDATVDIAMDLMATGRSVRVGYTLGLLARPFMSA
jgi:hypothetical protein